MSFPTTFQETATAQDAGGITLTGKTIVWASLNPSVASVSSTGLISGLADGTATITASCEGVTSHVDVTVVEVGYTSLAGEVKYGSTGINGITLRLYNASGLTLIDTLTTFGGGVFGISGLALGRNYIMKCIPSGGYVLASGESGTRTMLADPGSTAPVFQVVPA